MLTTILGLGVAVYLGATLLVWGAQGALMYPVPPDAERPAAAGARLLEIPCAGAGPVVALYVPAPAGAPTLVTFHGNGEQLAWGAPLVEAFAAAGVGVLATEYPGYGVSRAAGPPTEARLYAAAEAALAHLREELGVPATATVVLGQSLGSGVAAEMALRGHAARLAMVSAYTSMVDMGRRVVPLLPVGLLLRDRYDTAAKAPRITVPTLLIHGRDDAMIPAAMSERLAARFPHAELVLLEGRGHNDVYRPDPRALVERIAAFARSAAP